MDESKVEYYRKILLQIWEINERGQIRPDLLDDELQKGIEIHDILLPIVEEINKNN